MATISDTRQLKLFRDILNDIRNTNIERNETLKNSKYSSFAYSEEMIDTMSMKEAFGKFLEIMTHIVERMTNDKMGKIAQDIRLDRAKFTSRKIGKASRR
tara:strand:+ start:1041 stop:1340 length:300 start_codon:yes stop_codon:yes gene_type:complete